MLLQGKKILIMGIRNKWSIAWGAAVSAYEQGAHASSVACISARFAMPPIRIY